MRPFRVPPIVAVDSQTIAVGNLPIQFSWANKNSPAIQGAEDFGVQVQKLNLVGMQQNSYRCEKFGQKIQNRLKLEAPGRDSGPAVMAHLLRNYLLTRTLLLPYIPESTHTTGSGSPPLGFGTRRQRGSRLRRARSGSLVIERSF